MDVNSSSVDKAFTAGGEMSGRSTSTPSGSFCPLCGAYELQLTAELTAGLGQTTPDAIVRASSQLIGQAADLMESKAAFVQLVVFASVVERDAEIQRLAHINWLGDNVIKSLSSCRTNVRFLKEIVHHVTRWADVPCAWLLSVCLWNTCLAFCLKLH